MERKLPGILVVGVQRPIEPFLQQLEGSGRYQLTFAPDFKSAAGLLPRKPSVVLMHLPTEHAAAEEAFAYLQAFRKQAPVVVMSLAPDMRLYLNAMTLGAFDYFTSYTPLEEATRVLEKAIGWQRARAA